MSEREVSLAETIGAVFLRTLNGMVTWAQSRSMWPLMFGSSCCAVEMMHAASSRIDLDRFGCLFDIGPEGGNHGGAIVAQGSPEEIVRQGIGYTAQFLREKLL
jgi:NADH:ubiquinone oxidoreductase subunit B-like Fe-S oxidoreductase